MQGNRADMRAERPRRAPAPLLVVSCILLACVAGRQPAAAAELLSLPAAVIAALADGPEARVAHLESRSAEESAAAARSLYWPRAQVTSRAGYSNRLNDRLRAVDASGRELSYGLASIGASEGWFNFFVHQVLFDLARWADVRRAEQEAVVAHIAETERRNRIAHEVVVAYVGALRLARLIEQQQARLEHVARLDERAAALLRIGRSLEAEREEVALYRREVEIELDALADRAAAALAHLALLTGRDPGETNWRLDPASLPVPSAADELADKVEAAPAIRLLALRLEIEELRLQAARSGRLPTVNVGAGYSHYGAKRFDNFADELRVGIDFRMPVFDGFQARHAIAAAEQATEAARLRHTTALASERQQIEELTQRLGHTRRHAELAAERLRLGDERIRLADLALDAQRGSVSLALAARREVERSANALVLALHEPLLIWAELQRNVGQLADLLAGDEDPA